MSPISRRSLLARTLASATLAGLPVPAWLGGPAAAQATRTRYDAATPQGQTMLAKYANAVALMKDESRFPVGDARSWTFQWYTHWLPPGGDFGASSRQKASLIAALPAQYRALADAMWNTCQAHSYNSSDASQFQEWFFLPWHRWYVFYLEQIVRATLGDDSFTLPYWNYLSGRVEDLSIPETFRDTTSPLYQASRNPWVNAGQRIDNQNHGALNLRAFRETRYIDRPTGNIGFCPVLDGNPHGMIHVLIGDVTNMGNVPTAAQDPIFWLHHCNIDRLWESWCRLPGRSNPNWPGRSFAFADGDGNGVAAPADGVGRVADLKYDYDSYVDPTAIPQLSLRPTVAPMSMPASTPVRMAISAQPIALGTVPARVTLAPADSAGGIAPLAEQPTDLPEDRQLYVVVRDLMAEEPPGVTYNLFLDLPEGTKSSGTDDPHYIGTFGFFGAVGMRDHGIGHTHSIAVEISDTVQRLRANKMLADTTTVTIESAGEPSETAKPTVQQIELVEA